LMKRILHLFPRKFLFQYCEKLFVGLQTHTLGFEGLNVKGKRCLTFLRFL
jgi:hypothetical protein